MDYIHHLLEDRIKELEFSIYCIDSQIDMVKKECNDFQAKRNEWVFMKRMFGGHKT